MNTPLQVGRRVGSTMWEGIMLRRKRDKSKIKEIEDGKRERGM